MKTYVYCASSGGKRLVDGHIQFVNNVGSDQSIKKYPIIGYRYCFFEKFIFLELLELANKTSLFFV